MICPLGNWNSIYHKFRKWCANDVFENILQALVADTEKYLLVEIDSTFCKVHQHATGALKKHGNQAIRVSRGGKFMLSLLKTSNLSDCC